MRQKDLFFRKNGMPRWYLQRILFSSDKIVRPKLRRIVYRKNGLVRPAFQTWVARTYGVGDSPTQQDDVIIPKLTVLESLRPLEETAAAWTHGKSPETSLSASDIVAKLSTSGQNEVLICVSHDNYRKVQGGVQLCIRREEKHALNDGVAYLNIHPWQPYPRLAHLSDEKDPFVSLVWNGEPLGEARISAVTDAVNELAAKDIVQFNATLHQLMGHNPEQIADLVLASRAKTVMFWLHDYFALCPNPRLTRNNMAFCGAPALDSNSCGLCVFGKERETHIPRMTELLEKLTPTLVSPSAVTAELWKARFGRANDEIVVLPHIQLDWQMRNTPLPDIEHKTFKVGFLGTAEPHKGWPEFERLSQLSSLKDKFQFVALTVSKVSHNGKRVPVRVTYEEPNAMAHAVRDHDLDLVLHWPDWPETFALTAFEALEGGAYVITNSRSGNVAAAIGDLKRGAVLETEQELVEFFENGGAETLAKDAQKTRQSHEVKRCESALSLHFLSEKA